MLAIKENYQLFTKHKALTLCVFLFLFYAVLRVYAPTSILPELLVLVLFFYMQTKPVSAQDRLVPKNAFTVWILYFVYFAFSALLTYNGADDSGFFNENYRFIIFILILFLFASARIDYLSFSKLCLLGCRFHVFFTIMELVYLTFVAFGDFYGVPLVGKAMPEMDEGTGYLLENDNMISFGFRPFGLMLQPQKTGFIFVIGTVLEYVIAKAERRDVSKLWIVIFAIISIFQGAKTAFLMLFVIAAAILFDIYPAKKRCLGRFVFYSAIAIAVLYILIHNIALTNVGNDTNDRVLDDIKGFLSYGPFAFLFGIGVPINKYIIAHGFSGECYFMRIFCNWGVPLTLFLAYYLVRYLSTKDRKMNYILAVALFGMIYHYCVINSYFVSLAYISAVCLALRNDKESFSNKHNLTIY